MTRVPMGSPRPVGRGRRLVAITGSAALAVGLVSLATAAGAATVRGGGAAADQRVTYEGYTFAVPGGWQVVNLAAHPRDCVEFDRNVVYLGTPGANQACPARAVGDTTQALLIQPAAASTAPSAVNDPVSQRITARDARIQVTASYGGDRAQVQQILASAALPTPVTRTPRPAAAAPPAASAANAAANATAAAAPAALSPTNETGKGFDACTAPSSANMSAWKSDSPYSAVGIYIGGPEEACSQPNLTAGWVSAQTAAGWALIPIYVGPQAEFGQLSSPASQGTAAADAAIRDAEGLGIEPGATLYDDMESYPSSDNSAVVSFVSAWTIELHRYQYESGIYSSSDSGVTALAGTFSNSADAAPDVIYDALWNGDANTSDANIPAGDWAHHQRIHQYNGGVSQTYGGYTLNVDQDYLDVQQPYGKAEPAATVDASGTVRVFVRGTNRAMYTDDLPAGGSWTGFTDLNGTWPYDPAVLTEADGDVQVFAVGTNNALYADTESTSGWSGWSSLGGNNQGTPTVVQDSGGTVRVFVRGVKGALWEDTLAPGSTTWSGLTSLGGTWANDATALAESDGDVQVFAVGNDAALYAGTQSGSTWSGWTSLGGSNQGLPAAVQDTTGAVRVFVRGGKGAVWTDSLPSGSTTWSGLTSLGGTWRDNPEALAGSGGSVWVFATGVTSNLYDDELPTGTTTWTGWSDLGGSVTGQPAAVQDTTGTIRVYARGTGSGAALFEAVSRPSWTISSRGGALY
ncbi:MAG TPA: glycoside hydrolase domain-containing protein [Streptosporangiaceae bacterium]|nr:glycoside hydrolase domain-containing protein [Streptosporangiaceae bacterium]